MRQLPSFIDHNLPQRIYKLYKNLYGLKQAPRAWYHELQTHLVSIEFHNSQSNNSLFIYSHESKVMSLLVYMDDLIIIDNKPIIINQFIQQLGNKFSIEDLGPSAIFLVFK